MAKCETCKFDNVCDFSGTFQNNVRECRTYEQKEPQTWGNKIRSMSDEELAEFICGVFDEDECDGKYICGVTIPNYDEDRIAEWLKSEAKE
jgi:hypothetical protein